jgi:hypothetical protein
LGWAELDVSWLAVKLKEMCYISQVGILDFSARGGLSLNEGKVIVCIQSTAKILERDSKLLLTKVLLDTKWNYVARGVTVVELSHTLNFGVLKLPN